jgi:hypothetical protein
VGRAYTKQRGRLDRWQGRWALAPGETGSMRRVQAPIHGRIDSGIGHLNAGYLYR